MGYSQTELAKLADLAPGQVNRYEAGKNMPRLHVIGRLAASLGVHPEWLHLGEGPRETGSVTAHSKRLDVTTTVDSAGGMEVSFAMDAQAHAVFSKLAAEAGMSIDEFLKEELLMRARAEHAAKSEADIEHLARRVKELIQADEKSKT